MKALLFILALASFNYCFCQPDVDSLIRSGIGFHDKGDYGEAIKKYDEALARNPRHYMANYEKSYTFFAWKKYDSCIEVCKYLLAEFKGNAQNRGVYITYGSVLDFQNKPMEAVTMYDEGLKEFPDYYLLHFNKAITLLNQKKLDEAQQSLQSALKNNFFHASSHYAMAIVMQKQNKIASLLSSLTFLALESTGKRAKANWESIETILGANVTRNGDKNTTITMPSPQLDQNASSENNFRPTEILMSLSTAVDNSDKYKNETLTERMERKLTTVISSLRNRQQMGKGFFWEHYVPFFIDMESKKMVKTFSHLVCTTADDAENNKWLSDHQQEVTDFSGWVQQYKSARN